VQAEDRLRHRVLERALRDHQLRAAVLAFGRHLLGRLEDELHRAVQLRAQADQDLGDAHQDRDVAVVATGVHHADVLAVPGRARLRRERQVDVLGHRQRVHVGTKRDDRPRESALQQADHAGVCNPAAHLVEAEVAQVRLDDGGGAELAVAELGVRVQVTPPGDDPSLDGPARPRRSARPGRWKRVKVRSSDPRRCPVTLSQRLREPDPAADRRPREAAVRCRPKATA
jgi:hypothetical protein